MGSVATPTRGGGRTSGERIISRDSRGAVNLILVRLQDLLRRIADVLDRHQIICVVLIVGSFVPLAVVKAHRTLLTNDEIYTVHIAQAPSVRAMLALSREIDLHPPLHYLLQRVSLRSGLPRWEASRLPSQIAALGVLLGLFFWVARRFGNVFGMVAVNVLWLSPVLEFGWSNRPYMLWLGFLCLLLLARDEAKDESRRWWAIPLVFLLTLGMVGSHLLGIACIVPFLVAEVWRFVRTRLVDWQLIVALCLPALCGFGFFYQIHHLSQNAFPSANTASIDSATQIYTLIVGNTAVVLAMCMVAAILIFGRGREMPGTGEAEYSQRGFTGEDGALLLSLLVLPLLLLAASAVLHVQFWLRYGFAAAPAWAALAVWVLAKRLPVARMVAVIVIVAGLGYMVQRVIGEDVPQGNAGNVEGGRKPISLKSLDPSLPIVAASPMTYVEMSDREDPAIAKRVFYLTDHDGAMNYAHYTLFENEGKIRRLLGLSSQTADLTAFLSTQPRFYVVGEYGRPEVWLLRKLAADGLTMNYLGKFESTYESDDIFLVTATSEQASAAR